MEGHLRRDEGRGGGCRGGWSAELFLGCIVLRPAMLWSLGRDPTTMQLARGVRHLSVPVVRTHRLVL